MQRLNHHHLYLFWIFTKTCNLTKTAEDLGIAQSAVTLQLKNLEEALSISLIDRTNPRRLSLTPQGKQTLKYASSIFETSRELINWATKGELPQSKTIRIGALSGLSRNLQYTFVEPLLNNENTKFYFTTGDQKKLIELLSSHELDVVLSSHNVGETKSTKFYTYLLTQSPMVISCQKDSNYKKMSSMDNFKLLEPIYIPGKSFESRAELDAVLEKHKLPIKGEIEDIALLRLFAIKSGALVILPQMGIQNDIETKNLKVIYKIPKIYQKYYAITREKLQSSNEVHYLIQQMQKIKF